MRIDGPQVTSSLSLNGTTITDLNVFVTTASFNGLTGSYATTGSNLFNGTQTLSGSILPSVNNTYDLGSPTQQFRHVYISSGSLYVNGTKVLGSTSQELQITTDGGQSFKILESGSDTITLQSVDGNVTLTSSGQGDIVLDPTTGIIGLKGTVTVYSGNKITSSDGNSIQFGNGIAVTGSIVSTVTPLVSGSSQVLNGSGVWSGSAQLPSGIISGSSQLPSGIVSSSLQVTGYGFATTGSNAFTGTQTITGSLYISSDLVVQGSSSLQNITASAVNIGANIVNLNTANPAIRFAGLNIFDSGSIGGSGSFLYDSVQDEMIFVHRGDNTNITSSVVLMGPQTYNNIGSEIYPTANRILKGTGNEHVGDSIISETGGGIGISGSLSITGSVLVGVDKGIIFDSSGASGNPEISIDSNVDLNFKNSAGLTNLKLKNNGDIILSGSLSGTTATLSSILRVGGANGNFLIDSYTTSKIGIRSWTDIAGTTNNFFVQNNANYNYGIFGVVSASGTATGDVYGLGYSPSAGTSMTPVLRWTSDGNVGIGIDPQGLLDVYKSTSGGLGGHIYLRNNGAAVGNEMAVMFVDGDASTMRAAISSTTEGAPYFGDIKFKTGLGTYSSLTTKMTVSGEGKVGIGFTPSYKLQVAGEITTHAGTNTSYYAYMNYLGTTYNFGNTENTDNVDFKIAGGGTFTSGGNFRWFTQTGGGTPVERVRIGNNGLKFQNGASSLNYYEEGSFTPTSVGSNMTTVTAGFGKYVRIGNQVTVNVRWTVSPGGTGQKYLVFHLPFAFAFSSSIGYTGAVSNYNNGLSAYSSNVGTTVRNSSGSDTQQYVEAVFTTNAETTMHLSMTYFTF